MEPRRILQEKKLPKDEFATFSAALQFLSKLDSKNEYPVVFTHLMKVCNIDKGNSMYIYNTKEQIIAFENKFRRKMSKSYDTEAFDLNVITESLNSVEKQEMYLLRNNAFIYKNPRQLINIVCKILNHFRLKELSEIVKINYHDQVTLASIEKYPDPEHKAGQVNPPVTRYPSLLVAINSRSGKSNFDSPRPNKTLFMHPRKRLIPQFKLTPRMPLELSKSAKSTPSGIKYDIGEKEYLKDMAEIVSTEKLLKINKNKGASKTPGPILLSSFPIASSHSESTQTIPDLIRDYHVSSVVTIDENFVAEHIFNHEKKALPSDWLQHGVSVGLVQCPDLHPLRISHNLLVAQYLFAEVKTLLPSIKDRNHTNLILDLMDKRFQDADKNNKLDVKKNFVSDLYYQVTDEFKKINLDPQKKALATVMTELGWNKKAEHQAALQEKPVNQQHALIHCKAGMNRSATALLSMYIMFVDVILCWHYKNFIIEERDEAFFGAIVKAIFAPNNHDPLHDVRTITGIFSTYFRPIKLFDEQVLTLAQLIQYKRGILTQEVKLLQNCDSNQEIANRTPSGLIYKK